MLSVSAVWGGLRCAAIQPAVRPGWQLRMKWVGAWRGPVGLQRRPEQRMDLGSKRLLTTELPVDQRLPCCLSTDCCPAACQPTAAPLPAYQRLPCCPSTNCCPAVCQPTAAPLLVYRLRPAAGEGLPRGGAALCARRAHPLQPGSGVRQHRGGAAERAGGEWGRQGGSMVADAREGMTFRRIAFAILAALRAS